MEDLPENPKDLGAALRRLRGRKALRDMVNEDPTGSFSKSTLGRYEQGQLLPPLKSADRLDALYDADGWIAATVRSMWNGRWSPWSMPDLPRITHDGSWAAGYSGPVWIWLRPNERSVGLLHSIGIFWGPWQYLTETVLPADGIIFETGKSIDVGGQTVDCLVSADIALYALFTAPDGYPRSVTDIRERWTRRHPPHDVE